MDTELYEVYETIGGTIAYVGPKAKCEKQLEKLFLLTDFQNFIIRKHYES